MGKIEPDCTLCRQVKLQLAPRLIDGSLDTALSGLREIKLELQRGCLMPRELLAGRVAAVSIKNH